MAATEKGFTMGYKYLWGNMGVILFSMLNVQFNSGNG